MIGADCWLEPEGSALPGAQMPPPQRLLLLVQNTQGYLNLCELISRAWLTNVIRNQACLKREWLAELNEGLVCLTGFAHGPLAMAANDPAKAEAVAVDLAQAFPGRLYVELQRVDGARNERLVRASCTLAAKLGLPVVATHPIQFMATDEFDAHEARVCIAEGETLDNPKRVKRFTPDQHFKTQADMAARFADIPSALANTLSIAERCSLTLVLGKPQLPNFPTPLLADGTPMPTDDYFRQLSFEGLETRLVYLFPKETEREAARPRYVERLEFELNTIIKMKFPGYFLIVADFINWAKNNACPVGPGRGSGAGSLVAYALGITDLDPLAYNLLFERFLNPERVSMPDFDIDFCQGNRDRVIDYVKDKYGRDAVSQIATFGTMAAKAALRDVGRVLGMSYGHVDSIAKLIPAPPGKTVTLAPGAREARHQHHLRPPRGPRAGRARAQRRRGRHPAGLGHAGGRPDPQHRHARRGRAHRAGQDHRLLPAVPAARQRLGGEPVRQGRRRGHRPGEVRLLGPGHAHHLGAGQAVHHPAAARLRLRAPAAERHQDLQAVCRRQDRGGVPV